MQYIGVVGSAPIELDDAALECWRRHRTLHLPGALRSDELSELRRWLDEVAAWPEVPGRWMKYFESGSAPGAERQLSRVENFLPYHAGLRGLLARRDLAAALERLMGEPAVLFKEKINFKLPGGGGFAAHQDAPAFASFGQTYHVSLMLGIDAAHPANGCLEIVEGHCEASTLAQAADGTLAPAVIEALAWKALPTQPGDLLLFDSYVPHRSGPNRTSAPRRALAHPARWR